MVKTKPHEDPKCPCKACTVWDVDTKLRARAKQLAEEDQRVFEIMDRIVREGFDPKG